jgi:hypothetical protein
MAIDQFHYEADRLAKEYFVDVISIINMQLGDGYAEAHPELIGAFMQTRALNLNALVCGERLERLSFCAEEIADALTKQNGSA